MSNTLAITSLTKLLMLTEWGNRALPEISALAREAIRHLEADSWQPIETAPFNKDLLVIQKSGYIMQNYRSRLYVNTWTHWRPLPLINV